MDRSGAKSLFLAAFAQWLQHAASTVATRFCSTSAKDCGDEMREKRWPVEHTSRDLQLNSDTRATLAGQPMKLPVDFDCTNPLPARRVSSRPAQEITLASPSEVKPEKSSLEAQLIALLGSILYRS